MNVSPQTPAWLWPALLLAAAILAYGLYLARTGFTGRRRGAVPHCARCDYIVGGLEPGRCPECGADLAASGAILLGERHRRRGRGTAGLLLVALGLALAIVMLTPGVRRIDWYQYRPTSWVMRDFRSTDSARSDRAWTELYRRALAVGLSDAQVSEMADVVLDRYAADPRTLDGQHMTWVQLYRPKFSVAQRERLFAGLLVGMQSRAESAVGVAGAVLDTMIDAGEFDDTRHARLAETALAEQSRPPGLPGGDWLLDYLGDRELAGRLTAEQRERFYRQAYFVVGGLAVRKTCVAGEPIPYRYALNGRGPENDHQTPQQHVWWVKSQRDAIKVDGKLHASGGGSMSSTSFSPGSSGSSLRGVGVGKHTLEVELTLSIHHDAFAHGQGKPRWTRKVTLAGEFEVVAEAPPGLLKWLDDPGAAETIQAAIKPRDVRREPKGQPGIQMMLDINALPAPVAFEVIGRVGGEEHPIGTVAFPAGYSTSYGFGSMEFPKFAGDRVDLIFRSSDKALGRTVDMYEAWRGELVYEDVEVKDEP